ncbi:MAG: hypothetical protein GX792_07260 [Bacteroidales bacterium]|nr:hypothetical protein [Bacteroidales bacterium]
MFIPQKKGELNIKVENFGTIEATAVVYTINEEGKLKEVSSSQIPCKVDIPEEGKDYFIAIKDRWDANASPDLMKVIFTY